MYVNYVREREAFYEWLTFNTLSPTAQSLWNALFTICNAKGWPEGFVKVPDMLIRSYMHVSNDALLDARNQLKNKGLLEFTKGERRASAAAYKLNFFTAETEVCPEKAAKGADKAADKGADKPTGKPADKGAGKGADTNKLNTNGTNSVNQSNFFDDDDEEAAAFMRAHERVRERVGAAFRANFGREPTEAELQTISLNAVNLELEQIIHRAIETAARHGAKTPALYIASICQDWHFEQIHNADELDRYLYLKDCLDGRINYAASVGHEEAYRLMKEGREERYRRYHPEMYDEEE